MEDDYYCPMPIKWNEICQNLLDFWEKHGKENNDKPPIPLILAAWYDTPGLSKLLRWKETIEWAEKQNCQHLIPELNEEEKFRG